MKKWKSRTIAGLLLGLLVYAGLTILGETDKVLVAAGNFCWGFAPVVLALSFANFLVRWLRWEYYLKSLKISIPVGESFLVFLSSMALAISPGKVGDLLKSYYLKKLRNVSYAVSMPIVLAERISDFLGIVILTVFGVIVFDYWGQILIAVLTMVILAVLILSNTRLTLPVVKWLAKVPKFTKLAESLEQFYYKTSRLLRFDRLILGALVSSLAWGLECLGLFFVFLGLGVFNISPLTAAFVYAFGTLAGAVSLMPGGLGLQEATMTSFLIMSNIEKSYAVAATLLVRAGTLWFAVLLGSLFWAGLAKYVKFKIHREKLEIAECQ